MGHYQRSAVSRHASRALTCCPDPGFDVGNLSLVVQSRQTLTKPRKHIKSRNYRFGLQQATQCAGNDTGDFVGPIAWLEQRDNTGKPGKRQWVDINLALKPPCTQKAQRRRNCPTGTRGNQAENRLVAIQLNPALRLQFQPGQMGGDLSPHQLAAIIAQEWQVLQHIKAIRRPVQIASRHDQYERIAQQEGFGNSRRHLKRAGGNADIKTAIRDTLKDCMAGCRLQRQITLSQHAGQPDSQLWRYVGIEIVDDAKSQAAQAGHIHQRQCSRSVPQLRHRVAHMHQIRTTGPSRRQGSSPMIDQSLPQRRLQLFQLLRCGGGAEAEVTGSVSQAAGSGDLLEHLDGAQRNRFAKKLRQDSPFRLAGVSGQDTSNSRGAPYMTDVFRKSFTQQEPISEAAIARATDVMRSGRLHRYNVAPGEVGPVAEFERAFADWLGVPYALALASGGQALQIALRAAGVKPGDRVLTNGFTLAPVPGAIAAVGARPLLVETAESLRPDLDDLDAKAASGEAKVLMLSNMRGHLPDMEAIQAICTRHGLLLMEDCAHTMGAAWKGKQSGTFGIAGCFSTQTYKHMNSGEGGILTSDDPAFMARATVLSGSYMLYARHGAGPDPEYFDDARYDMPNCSARMDAVRATLLLDQIGSLPDRITRWNERYHAVESGLSSVRGLTLPHRPNEESYVGSSIQFLVPKSWTVQNCTRFSDATAARGVEVKWFGAAEPKAFTSRYDSWHYAKPDPLPKTDAVLERLFDMRLPLTFDVSDCTLIAQILADEFAKENRSPNPTGV
jgi:dTDP-4-amino-4,6-dideoxygalactose transaminase